MKSSERRGRATVYARSGAVCEFCGTQRATSYHHRLKRSHGGSWDPANGLHLCGDGVTGCHGRVEANPLWARELGLAVASWDDPLKVPVQTWHGLVLLDDDGGFQPVTEEVSR